jgi:hypothetical protein
MVLKTEGEDVVVVRQSAFSLAKLLRRPESMGEFLELQERAAWILPLLFLFFVVPSVIFLAVCTPPFQSPDEPSHIFRAYQISEGGLAGSGAYIDPALDEVYEYYAQLPFHAEARSTTERDSL